VVYGSPYKEGKMDFLLELEGLLDNWDGPTVIGGDFNIVTTAREKSNGQVNQKWVKSNLHPPTFTKVQISTSNFKIG